MTNKIQIVIPNDEDRGKRTSEEFYVFDVSRYGITGSIKFFYEYKTGQVYFVYNGSSEIYYQMSFEVDNEHGKISFSNPCPSASPPESKAFTHHDRLYLSNNGDYDHRLDLKTNNSHMIAKDITFTWICRNYVTQLQLWMINKRSLHKDVRIGHSFDVNKILFEPTVLF